MNASKAEPPSTCYIVNICPECQSSIHIHYKVTGLQLWKNYTIRVTKLCVTKIIITEKIVGVGSSNLGFVHLDN